MGLYLGIVLFLIFVTRVLAYWSVYVLQNQDITLIPGVLYLSYVENTGAAFGIFRDSKIFLVIIALVLFFVLTYYVVQHRKTISKKLLIPMAAVAGGGISNVADRLQFGFVADYIDFRFIHYPVFNLADICVVVGVIVLAGVILFTNEQPVKQVDLPKVGEIDIAADSSNE